MTISDFSFTDEVLNCGPVVTQFRAMVGEPTTATVRLTPRAPHIEILVNGQRVSGVKGVELQSGPDRGYVWLNRNRGQEREWANVIHEGDEIELVLHILGDSEAEDRWLRPKPMRVGPSVGDAVELQPK